jgi:hypothetical protein
MEGTAGSRITVFLAIYCVSTFMLTGENSFGGEGGKTGYLRV